MTKRNGTGFVGRTDNDEMVRALGWFSVGIGLIELLTPRKVSSTIDIGDHPAILRLLGLRELASGLGILTQRNPSAWMKGRFAGDLIDIALLGASVASGQARATRAAAAAVAIAKVACMDYRCSRELSAKPETNISAVHVTRAVTIDRPAEELFWFWRNFENLPRFMSHLHSVRVEDDKQSEWTAKGPAGAGIRWRAEIVNEHPNELIAWRSLEGTPVRHAGSVRFSPAPGNRGTVVRVEMKFEPVAGVLGVTLARLFGKSPERTVAVDLMQFKQLMETGEIARTQGQPAGRKKSISRKYDEPVKSPEVASAVMPNQAPAL